MKEKSLPQSVWSPAGQVDYGEFHEVLTIPGKYLNDHCFVRKDGLWHFFGIVGPVGKGCYDAESEVSFAHATSADLENWTIHDDVMRVSGTWPETSHVFAPSIVGREGRFFMLYTALDDDLNQRICLATSQDLFSWERQPHNPVIVPSLQWARWPGFGQEKAGNCRDPHIFQLADGRYAAYWVAEMQPRFGPDLTCVAASLSEDLVHWQEVGPVFVMRAWKEPPTRAVESPCVVFRDGRYWLFFKYGWWTWYCVSDDPLDFRHGEPLRLGFSHASEIFEWNGGWMISHCSGDPRDHMYRETNRQRGLFLGRLDWPDGMHPRLAGAHPPD